MNTYRQSNGARIKKSVIDARVRRAKKEVIEHALLVDGYVVCQDCKRNDCQPVDCSHDVSVDQCQKQGMAELSWDKSNITLRGRACHIKHDTNQMR